MKIFYVWYKYPTTNSVWQKYADSHSSLEEASEAIERVRPYIFKETIFRIEELQQIRMYDYIIPVIHVEQTTIHIPEESDIVEPEWDDSWEDEYNFYDPCLWDDE